MSKAKRIALYEAKKKQLMQLGLSPDQYEKKLREIARKLKI